MRGEYLACAGKRKCNKLHRNEAKTSISFGKKSVETGFSAICNKLQKQLKNSDRTINFGDCSARLVLPGIPKQSGIQHRVSTNTLVLNTTVLILL